MRDPAPLDPQTPVRCAECGREVDEFTAIKQQWRYWSDGLGELHPYCPECAEREFDHSVVRSGSAEESNKER